MFQETDVDLVVRPRSRDVRANRLMKIGGVIAIIACSIMALDSPRYLWGVGAGIAAFSLAWWLTGRNQPTRINKRNRSVQVGHRELSSKQLLCILATSHQSTSDFDTSPRAWGLTIVERSTEPLLLNAIDSCVRRLNEPATAAIPPDITPSLANALEQFLFDGVKGRTLLTVDTDEVLVTSLGHRISKILRLPFVDACNTPPRVYLPDEIALPLGQRALVRRHAASDPPGTATRTETEALLTLTWVHNRYGDQILILQQMIVLPLLAALWGASRFILFVIMGACATLANPDTRNPLRGHGRNTLVLEHDRLLVRLAPLHRDRLISTQDIVMFRADRGLVSPRLSIVLRNGAIRVPATLAVADWLCRELENRLALLAEREKASEQPGT